MEKIQSIYFSIFGLIKEELEQKYPSQQSPIDGQEAVGIELELGN